MPSRSEILAQIESLKTHSLEQGKEMEENEVWFGGKHGATFEFMKLEGIIFDGQDALSLLSALRGKPKGKDELKSDFVGVLGKPKIEIPAGKHHPQILIWSASSISVIQPK